MQNDNIEKYVNTYLDMVLKIAFQNCFNKSDSEDIAQDVFLKLIKNISKIENEEHLKFWLIRVTINTSKDYNKNIWNSKINALDDNSLGYDFSLEDKEIFCQMKNLKPIERNIIYLYYYEGFKLNEIAKILNKNPNTVASLLRRGKEKLKNFLNEGGEIYE